MPISQRDEPYTFLEWPILKTYISLWVKDFLFYDNMLL